MRLFIGNLTKNCKKNEKSFDESRDFFVAVFAVEFKL